MTIDVRPGTPEDIRAITDIDGISFGFSHTDQHRADVAERGINFTLAVEGERVVGVSGDFRFGMTVPGGASLVVPGVTWVSVLPNYRRRGVLTTMMGSLLDGYAAAGDPCAVLTASEGGIYRRFGYGVATQHVRISIDRRLTALRTPVDTSEVQFLSTEQARTRLPELHRQWEQHRPGALSRDEAWWKGILDDKDYYRDGLTEAWHLAHPGGYLSYRAKEVWDGPRPGSKCIIVDYKITTPEAHAALWQVLLGLDLFASIESWQIPADDPLPLLLTNPREVQFVASKDGMWLRPIDVAAMLSARTYQVELDTVLDVDGQRFALTGGPDGANCVPTDRPAELWVDKPGLGSIYLGGYRVNTMARAGLLRCDRPTLVRQADLAFGTDRAPSYGTGF